MDLLFSEHEWNHMHWVKCGDCFFNCNMFFAFKMIVTEKLAKYCPEIPVFYSNRCYFWLVLKMAQLVKNLSPQIYLRSKLRDITVYSVK